MVSGKPAPNRYRMAARMDPRAGELRVEAAVEWRWPARDLPSEALFGLHKSVIISGLRCDPPGRWELRPGSPLQYSPEASTVAVIPSSPPAPGSWLGMELGYQLRPAIVQTWEVNRLTPEWVELGLYAPWFPLDVATGAPFEYIVEVEGVPGYELTGTGVVERTPRGWRLTSAEPGQDCVIIAAPALTEQRGNRLTVAHAAPGDAGIASAVMRDGEWVLSLFGDRFGVQEGGLRIVIAPRTRGGGYARPGLVVLTHNLSEPKRTLRWIAHEIAHLWWRLADARTWEDWLNESFAEYSAVLAVGARYGQDAADELLAAKRAAMPGLPPVMGLARDDERAYATIYGKGCVLLHDLAETIGQEAMAALLRDTYLEQVGTTSAFLGLLGRRCGEGAARQFEQRLKA